MVWSQLWYLYSVKILSLQETLVRSKLLQLKVNCFWFFVHTWHLQLNVAMHCKIHSILLHVWTCSLYSHYISICATIDLEGKSPMYLSIALNIMQPSWASSSFPSSDLVTKKRNFIGNSLHGNQDKQGYSQAEAELQNVLDPVDIFKLEIDQNQANWALFMEVNVISAFLLVIILTFHNSGQKYLQLWTLCLVEPAYLPD